MISTRQIDTTTIALILKHGDVNFSKSNTDLETCKIYVVYKTVEEKEIELTIENCETIATVKNISIE